MSLYSAGELERRWKRARERVDELTAERDRLRKRIAKLEHELDEAIASATGTPFTLTELHGYWLANHSPDEIERIAAGLSGWEMDSVREAA